MSKRIATLTAAVLLTTSVAVQADSDKNMQIMLKAARSLDFSEMGNQGKPSLPPDQAHKGNSTGRSWGGLWFF